MQHGDGYQVSPQSLTNSTKTFSGNHLNVIIQTFTNGNLLEGQWEEGKRHGGFIFTFPNGERWSATLAPGPGTWPPTPGGPGRGPGRRLTPCLQTWTSSSLGESSFLARLKISQETTYSYEKRNIYLNLII